MLYCNKYFYIVRNLTALPIACGAAQGLRSNLPTFLSAYPPQCWQKMIPVMVQRVLVEGWWATSATKGWPMHRVAHNLSLEIECLRQTGQCQHGYAGVGTWPRKLVVEMEWSGRRSAMVAWATWGASLWKAMVAIVTHLPMLTVVELTEK